MKFLLENPRYQQDVCKIAMQPLPWEKLKGKSLLISGATGLIGSFLIDVLMYLNKTQHLQCKVYALADSARWWHEYGREVTQTP